MTASSINVSNNVAAGVQVTLDVARDLTEGIRHAGLGVKGQLENLSKLMEVAKAGNVHAVLGYDSWTAYISATLSDMPMVLQADMRRTVVAELASQGMSARAIAPILGVSRATIQRDVLGGSFEPPHSGELSSPRFVEGRDGKSYSVPAPKAAINDTDLAFLNAPSEAFHFGTIDMNRESVGPSDIRSALAFLTSGETRLENVGKEVGLITTWIPKESRESRERIACIIVPPAVNAVATLSALLFESGLLDMFKTLPSNERAHTMQVLTASAINLTNACEAFNRLNEKNN